jgi:integrase
MQVDISDKTITKLPPGVHRDRKLPGLLVVVGKGRVTARYTWDEYRDGVRVKTHSRKLGVLGHDGYTAAIARKDADALKAGRTLGAVPPDKKKGITLGKITQRYFRNLEVQGISDKWINSQRGTFKRRLQQFEHDTLLSLGDRPEEIRDWFFAIGHYAGPPSKNLRKIGKPIEANKAKRLLRSIYRYAVNVGELGKSPPPDPTRLIVENPEQRRSKALAMSALAPWARKVEKIGETRPLVACFHKVLLLTGMRPSALGRLRRDEVNFTDEDVPTGQADAKGDPILIPAKSICVQWTKTGIALCAPMSTAIERELSKAVELGKRAAFDSVFVFPSTARYASQSGHFESWSAKEDKNALGHAGAWCRHQYRTLCHEMRVDPFSIAMLRGEAGQSVSEGYVTRIEMTKGPLREWQEKISNRLEELMAS